MAVKKAEFKWSCALAAAAIAGQLCYTLEANASGKLVLDADRFDFGHVDEGARVQHVFKITNSGDSELVLQQPYATCGCTLPKITKRKLAPGETTDLIVVVDTAMKQNKVTKTVIIPSNDNEHPVVHVNLSMDVHDPHTGMKEDAKAKIFSDSHCSSCHVERGRGLKGRELYNADCAMCHGPKAEGAIGPQLFGPYGNQQFAAHMDEVAKYGSKTHHSMPGFLDAAGGPLSVGEIDSVMDYLKKLSKSRGL